MSQSSVASKMVKDKVLPSFLKAFCPRGSTQLVCHMLTRLCSVWQLGKKLLSHKMPFLTVLWCKTGSSRVLPTSLFVNKDVPLHSYLRGQILTWKCFYTALLSADILKSFIGTQKEYVKFHTNFAGSVSFWVLWLEDNEVKLVGSLHNLTSQLLALVTLWVNLELFFM